MKSRLLYDQKSSSSASSLNDRVNEITSFNNQNKGNLAPLAVSKRNKKSGNHGASSRDLSTVGGLEKIQHHERIGSTNARGRVEILSSSAGPNDNVDPMAQRFLHQVSEAKFK